MSTPTSLPEIGFCVSSNTFCAPCLPAKRYPSGTSMVAIPPRSPFVGPTCQPMEGFWPESALAREGKHMIQAIRQHTRALRNTRFDMDVLLVVALGSVPE